MNNDFLNFIEQNPPATTTRFSRQTPMKERAEFIKHLVNEGFTIADIKKVYPEARLSRLKRIVRYGVLNYQQIK